MKTYSPQGVYFNENGVCEYGYVYTLKGKNFIVCLYAIRVNGMWMGTYDYLCPMFGSAHPLIEGCEESFPTLRSLVENLWSYVVEGVVSGFKYSPMGYGELVISAVKKASSEMLSATDEDILKCFTSKSFFGYE